MEILFWRHSTATQKRKGTCTLYLRVTIFGRRAELGSTSIRTFTDYWDQERQEILHSDPQSTFKNEQLNNIKSLLLGIYNELLRKKKAITADRVKQEFLRSDTQFTFMAAFSLFLKEYKADPSHAESSFKTLRNVRNLFGNFLFSIHRREVIIEDIDEGLMARYLSWMKSKHYEESYQVKTSRVVKQVVTWSKKKKMLDFDPLKDYAIKHEKKKKPIYLNNEQLLFWSTHNFISPSCQMAADLFVIYCRTGFHYQDLMQVIRNPDQHLRNGMDGKIWIYKPRQKTEVEAKVPVHQFANLVDPIISKYGGWNLLPTMTNKDLNGYLKLCVAHINQNLPVSNQIYDKLSVKHGRNSFCYHILNELAMDKERLITMLGRLSATDLDVYVRPDEVGIINAFKKQTERPKISAA
ncbi:phage integrase SAM-like domain-containing protein [Arundinibacter roseus]|nr:phage integrase SAM-like domain-containing protein [Arundinibacter roseus]